MREIRCLPSRRRRSSETAAIPPMPPPTTTTCDIRSRSRDWMEGNPSAEGGSGLRQYRPLRQALIPSKLLGENAPKDVDGLEDLGMRHAIVDRCAHVPALEDAVVPEVLEMQGEVGLAHRREGDQVLDRPFPIPDRK